MTTGARAGARVVRALAPVAALSVVALLAACGSSGGDDGSAGASDDGTAAGLELEAGSSVVGLPDGIGDQPADAAAGAARTSDDTLLYVITFGSSTCPAVADADSTSTGADAVEITFPAPDDGACTADYVPATTVVALPDDVDANQDLTVTVGTWGEVTLPAGSSDAVWVVAAG